MEFSAGTVVLIVGWGAVLLVLWNLQHFAKAFSTAVFWKTAAGLTLAAMAMGAWLFFKHDRHTPPRVLLFPFVEKSAVGDSISPWGFAFADQLTDALQQRRTIEFYPLPTPALFAFAHSDSLVFEEYAVRFARKIGLPLMGFGEYRRDRERLSMEFQLIDPARGKAILQSSFAITEAHDTGEAVTVLGEKLAAYFELKKATSFFNHSAATLTASQQSAYYSAYLNLLLRRFGPAYAQAAAWVKTEAAPFIALAARARMQQLWQQRAGELEWKNALATLVPELQNAAQRDSLYAPTFLLLGECYLQSQKWNEAENMLRRARALDPMLARLYVDMAQLHASRFAREGFKNELALYQHALKLNPLELDAVLGVVECYLRENRRNEALALLEKYRHLNPNHLPTLMALGRIHIEKGDFAQILPLFETLVRLDPQNVEAFYNLGIAYYHHNDLDNAQRFFERSLQLSNYAEAHVYLAQIYERRGDTTAAIPHLRERIRLSSGEGDAYAAEARKHLYGLLLRRGEIPEHLLPDTLMTK